ncbi:flavin-containing monooxygenase [Tomitella biformata]|uniref:flavin-containing monooxygenase n=1 Tax=Tomitella biformata TaxID=630403 RepID=UPI000570AB24|nr:NAD(P)/FAD-dependent oxidoreductase [Tomitella biformata]
MVETVRCHRVAIIGAGFGGLGTAIQLKRAGIDDFVVLERATEVGGTWQANTYPGAQCDIPAVLYSFSFAPNSEWSRLYPLQGELQKYLADCADAFGVTENLRLGVEVLDASWQEAEQLWRVTTSDGVYDAQLLVGAIGPFSAPSVPRLPGLDSFTGEVFHTADWNHDYDLAGKRVAVIGTGASAVQIVPQIQPTVAHLTVFQRTATWILPHPDQPLTGLPGKVFTAVPGLQWLARQGVDLVQELMVSGMVYRPALLKGLEALGRGHLFRQVRDGTMRAQLTPGYTFGCKRPTFSNRYYPALAQPNVDLVTEGIDRICPEGVRTADGTLHTLDAIVMSTGFNLTDHPGFGLIHGRDGRSMAQVWQGDAKAYLGITVAGFPNHFQLLGPNSSSYTSAVVTLEAQIDYIVSCLKEMDKLGLASVDVRPEVQDAFVAEVDRGLQGSVWNSGGCSSYYLNDAGRNFTFYPGFTFAYRNRTHKFDARDYLTETLDSAVRTSSC